ncbi:hypothetical protein MTP99_018470 [Tenebrio molitor]|jgi:hypothetical protein|nr:hypothetical protein MTP99_018470 [Tenebrio molitor]
MAESSFAADRNETSFGEVFSSALLITAPLKNQISRLSRFRELLSTVVVFLRIFPVQTERRTPSVVQTWPYRIRIVANLIIAIYVAAPAERDRN